MDSASTKSVTAEADESDGPLIIDMGKKSSKQVRRLKKGRGRLVEKIDETIERLRAQGQIAASAQTVIVVVRERKKRRRIFSPLG